MKRKFVARIKCEGSRQARTIAVEYAGKTKENGKKQENLQ